MYGILIPTFCMSSGGISPRRYAPTNNIQLLIILNRIPVEAAKFGAFSKGYSVLTQPPFFKVNVHHNVISYPQRFFLPKLEHEDPLLQVKSKPQDRCVLLHITLFLRTVQTCSNDHNIVH